MWQPDPGWERLPGGSGTTTTGVWRTRIKGRDVAVKRLAAPQPGDPPELTDASSPGWWRREADVALHSAVTATPGLRAPETLAVDEDADGITLVVPFIPRIPTSGLFVARALGRFTAASLSEQPWLARGQLRTRLDRVAYRGGWCHLARTSVADVAEHLWCRRGALLDQLDALPQVPQHGDPVPANLPAHTENHVLAVDWGTLGTGPVGADLGYWSLSAREEFTPLLDAYLGGLAPDVSGRDDAVLGARVAASYTVLTRADWALARVADGGGALAGKFRHPAVAPHLRALQRQFPQIEALLG